MYVGTFSCPTPWQLSCWIAFGFRPEQSIVVTSFQRTWSTLRSAPQQEENTFQNTKIFFLTHSHCFGKSDHHLNFFFPLERCCNEVLFAQAIYSQVNQHHVKSLLLSLNLCPEGTDSPLQTPYVEASSSFWSCYDCSRPPNPLAPSLWGPPCRGVVSLAAR